MSGENFGLKTQISEEDLRGLFEGGDKTQRIREVRRSREDKEDRGNGFWMGFRPQRRSRAGIFLKLIAIVVIGSMISWGSLYGFKKTSLGKNVSLWKLIKDGKYLVLFQNNSELRATGGFLGSFAVITLADAKVKDIYFETNIYKRDRTLTDKKNFDPPQPLKQFIGQGWAMRDSNNAVDFPEAAETIKWFFEQEGGYPVDGVVALDTTMMEDLLQLVGPIEMPEYKTTLSKDNFRSTIQYKVEKEYFQSEKGKAENEPKTILKDMLPKLIAKAEAADKKELAGLVLNELKEKHFLFYFNNPVAQKLILEKNWGGAVIKSEENEDYLYVNNSNLNGKKSSLNVTEDIRLNVSETANDLIITRTHTGSMEWPDGVNNNYVRILTPKGSELISVSLDGKDYRGKMDILEEAGKTVFGAWMNTAPQTSHVLRLKYHSPIKVKNDNYQIYVQKQPGTIGDDLEVSMGDKVLYKGKLETDKKIISK